MTTDTNEALDALINALRSGEQADMDGVMVRVSRQACEEAAARITDLEAKLQRLGRELNLAKYGESPTLLGSSPMITDLYDIDVLKELLAEATPGPWEVDIADESIAYAEIYENSGRKSFCVCSVTVIPNGEHINNARLIALAPELAAEVIALRAQAAKDKARIERLEAALRKMNVGDGWAARIARAALEDGE